MTNKTYTLKDLQDLDPCYDPIEYLPKDWIGTVLDILDVSDCPAEDRIWISTKLLDDKTNRLFAVACARSAIKLVDNTDLSSVEACNVAERYALGRAT